MRGVRFCQVAGLLVWACALYAQRDDALRADRLRTPLIIDQHTYPGIHQGRGQISSELTVSVAQLLHRVPKNARQEYERGLKANKRGRTAEAIAHLAKAVASDPSFTAARNALGVLYFDASQFVAAGEQFDQVIALNPHASAGYVNAGLVYIATGRPAEAERAARRSLDCDHASDSQAKFLLGLSLAMQDKDTENALYLLKSVAVAKPKAHLVAASLLAHNGRLTESRHEITAYLTSGDKEFDDLASQWAGQLDSIREKALAVRGTEP